MLLMTCGLDISYRCSLCKCYKQYNI